MTHTYNIEGMTCNGCVAKVRSELLKLGDITDANLQLAAPQATISMSKHIRTETLAQAIAKAGKYTITDAPGHKTPAISHATIEEKPSYLPIYLIFGYITGVTLLLQIMAGSFDVMQWMSNFMAGFFLVFSFFKLMNLKGFAEGYSSYDIVAARIPVYGYVYPFVELALGIAFLTGFNPLLTNIITLAVMGISIIGVIKSLMKKTPFQCACLGTVIKLPLSKVTLFEDSLMIAMSAAMLLLLW